MIGGAVTFVNPEPLALFADVIAAGEGEVLVPPLLRAFQSAVGSRRPAAAARRASAASTSRRSTTCSYAADGTIARVRAAARAPAPRRSCKKAALQDDRGGRSAGDEDLHAGHRVRLAVPRSRSCAAAPTCAASAGRATTTCRCARFRRSASWSWPSRREPYSNRVGLVSIALCDHPDIEEILTRLVEMGYSISPASLRLDDLTPTILAPAARRAASGRSRSRRKPAPIGCAASSTRRSPTTRSSRPPR